MLADTCAYRSRVVRKVVTTAFVVALIIFWSIPVAFVGAISQIDNLIKCLPFLSFINDIPKVILGVVTGLLPVVLLAVLMALLPIILRAMAKIGGAPTRSAVELTVQNTYFAFQLVQVRSLQMNTCPASVSRDYDVAQALALSRISLTFTPGLPRCNHRCLSLGSSEQHYRGSHVSA